MAFILKSHNRYRMSIDNNILIEMHEKDITLLKEEVAFLLNAYRHLNAKLSAPAPQQISKPIVNNLDLSKALASRQIKCTKEEYNRIQGIVAQYSLTDEQIMSTLDKVAIMARKEPIRNIAGYIHNTFMREHNLQRKDTA